MEPEALGIAAATETPAPTRLWPRHPSQHSPQSEAATDLSGTTAGPGDVAAPQVRPTTWVLARRVEMEAKEIATTRTALEEAAVATPLMVPTEPVPLWLTPSAVAAVPV